jgi:prophage antirepressor-like protein
MKEAKPEWKWLPIFQNTELGSLRVVVKKGMGWFVLKDVCDVLGIENSRDVTPRLDVDEKDTVDFIDGVGRPHTNTIVNEPGLYRILMRSNKQIAKTFQRWLAHEVVPTIRRQEKYELHQKAKAQQLRQAIDEIFARKKKS